MSSVKTVLELGNKTTKKGIPYRDWYVDQGCEYTSVDWNGKDGALKLDLQLPLNLGSFDLVTNFGTTEHVAKQIPCWKNVHEAVVLGGKFVNHTPRPGRMIHHGFWHPSKEWFEEFAAKNGYEVQVLVQEETVIHARLKKIQQLPFTMPKTQIHRTRLPF
jgi:hypothetical protein